MEKKLFKIGDTVKSDVYDIEGKIIAYALRDEMWSHRHSYKVRWNKFRLFAPREEWTMQNMLNKIIKN